jgi:DNA-binding CsgD family transcriptional regulator
MPAYPGLVLFDSTNHPIYFNREAVQVLTYPHVFERGDELASVLPPQIRSMLRNPTREVPVTEFRSGRRHYLCRLFNVAHNSQKPSLGVKALWIVRSASQPVYLSETAERFRLTPREQQTAVLLMDGLTSKEIATRMKISLNTVKTFVRILMIKMEVPTRSGIVGKLMRG